MNQIQCENKKPPLVILTGPTGVGKTELSIQFAKRMNGEIISADSIQVYQFMDIGSAKVTKEEMDGVNHYLVDILKPDEEFNIFCFSNLAKEAIATIYSHEKIPIIVGGTGFYIQSVLYDIDFNTEDSDKTVRQKYEKIASEKGTAYLHRLLQEVDPKSAKTIHENNTKRIIRALEYYENTGELMSVHNQRERAKTSPYHYQYFVLNRDRNTLYNRIDQRVDLMIKDGLVCEVKNLLNSGYSRNLVSMQGLGYKEIAAYIDGECTLEEAVDIIKRDTRHFAKRQLTWFRRERNVTFMNYEDYSNDINQMCDALVGICRKEHII
ncbi:MAG: tRNA (adenosine(37)-N6)-dimethylallyltransferase MiaA [Lachnospiraceae bacterium]|nr:tRNA (adenosine(37)-N6)-dimethylallyltransferase MiaA [Lachnospiraceae bacterium]